MSTPRVRTDLTFLRRRARPAETVPEPEPRPVPPVPPAARPVTAPRRSAVPAVRPVLPPHDPLPPLLDGLAPLSPGERRVLGPADPVVMLNRVQAGIGALRIEIASVHPFRLAMAYVWNARAGIVCGPGTVHGPDARRPVVSLVGATGASVDLGNVDLLDRFLLLLQAHQYGGALVASTVGGGRLEIPLPDEPAMGTLALMTGYRVRGALVLRAETDQITGGLREASRAYGYDEIGWLDANTPLTS